MTELINVQLDMVIVSLIMGFSMGFTYDVIRIFRRIVNHNILFISVEDLVYWLVWTVIVVDKIYIYNYGQIRFYIILGLFVGFLVYRYTIGWVLMKLANYMLCGVKNILKKAKKNLKNTQKKGNI